MSSRFYKAAILGILIALTGIGFAMLSFGFELEETVGLHLLFKLRGVRRPPSDVAVVSIDKTSADHLKLPYDTRKWPRTLHARLIEELAKQGASVIVFDMCFDETRSIEDDRIFARAVRKAGNVVLCARMRRDIVPLTGKNGRPGSGEIYIAKLVPTVSPINEAAAALAPFPLPKVPIRVNQFWTFTTGAGETPTLPVVALQLRLLPIYEEFIHIVEQTAAGLSNSAFPHNNELFTPGAIEKAISGIRDIFTGEPATVERILKAADSGAFANDPAKRRMIATLTRMYHNSDSLYLNFYGPPETITTIPYYQALYPEQTGEAGVRPDLKNKVVFVGLSEKLEFEQKDEFYTVYSQQDGRNICGVEIAATAFANLWEDTPVRPLGPAVCVAILILWGMASGMSCRLLPALPAFCVAVATALLYLFFAKYQFMSMGRWYPIVAPLFVQTPLAFFSAILWKFVDVSHERQNIRKAFGFYLPEEMIEKLAKNISEISTGSRLVYGICLCTDIERYTALAESMDPEELGRHMNEYFAAIFGHVKHYGGFISDLKGDSMLALWVSVQPDAALRDKACRAALEIDRSILHFNRLHEEKQLHTRIGVHYGQILLGNVGYMDHFEYRPLGDMVNTASRIENLNKYLGTRLLVSGDVLAELDGYLTRELGTFLPAGKTKPLVVHELLSPLMEADTVRRERCDLFDDALDRFRKQLWDEAAEIFTRIIKQSGDDGPARFYLKQCERLGQEPPGESWDGVIRMESK